MIIKIIAFVAAAIPLFLFIRAVPANYADQRRTQRVQEAGQLGSLDLFGSDWMCCRVRRWQVGLDLVDCRSEPAHPAVSKQAANPGICASKCGCGVKRSIPPLDRASHRGKLLLRTATSFRYLFHRLEKITTRIRGQRCA